MSKNQKYIDLISKSKEQVEKEQLELDNEAASIQLDKDIHSAKCEVVNRKKAVNAAKGAQPFNVARVIEAQRELAVAEKDIEDMLKIKAELF